MGLRETLEAATGRHKLGCAAADTMLEGDCDCSVSYARVVLRKNALELAALCLDMGDYLRDLGATRYGDEPGDVLLTRLDRIGKGADVSEERLVLEIEVPDFNVDGAQEAADEWYDGDILPILIEEWMRGDVILVANDMPGEKSQNHEFNLHALEGRIVGARIVR